MNKPTLRNKPLALLIGTGLGLGAIGAQAAPTFQATDLASGYAVAAADEAAPKKQAEHSCGEGGCGGDMGGDAAADKSADAKATDTKAVQQQPAAGQKPAAAKK